MTTQATQPTENAKASDQPIVGRAACELCGEPMPDGEEMFKYHGHSGPCPTKPKPVVETLRIKPISAEGEAERRYAESLSVMQRIVDASNRHHYEDGETLDEAIDAANEILKTEELERDIFGTPETNPNWPAPKPE